MWVGKRHGGIGTRRSGDRLSGSHHDENKCGSLQCFCSSLLGALRFQTRKGAMWRHGLLLIKIRGNMPACNTSWGSNRAQMVCAPAPVLVQLQTTPILPVFTRQTNKRSTPVRTTRFVRPAMFSSLLRRAVPRAASARAVLVASGPMRLQPTAFAGAGNVLATRLFATLSDDEMRREMDNINDAVRARRTCAVLGRLPSLPSHSDEVEVGGDQVPGRLSVFYNPSCVWTGHAYLLGTR